MNGVKLRNEHLVALYFPVVYLHCTNCVLTQESTE